MTRPDMSIKVERQLHDMRILGRIVGVRSTEQFVRHLLPPTSNGAFMNIYNIDQFQKMNTPGILCQKGGQGIII